jgi:hypothetical protein
MSQSLATKRLAALRFLASFAASFFAFLSLPFTRLLVLLQGLDRVVLTALLAAKVVNQRTKVWPRQHLA